MQLDRLQMQLQQPADLARLAGRDLAGRHRREQRRAGGDGVLRAGRGAEARPSTGRSRRAGRRRSRHRRSAVASPASASSMALRVSASPSPSSSAWIACVALWRAPLGRPELPGGNGRPRVVGALLRGVSSMTVSIVLGSRRRPVGAARAAAWRRGRIDVPARLAARWRALTGRWRAVAVQCAGEAMIESTITSGSVGHVISPLSITSAGSRSASGLTTARSAAARMRPASRSAQGWLSIASTSRSMRACARSVASASPAGSPGGSRNSLPRTVPPPPRPRRPTPRSSRRQPRPGPAGGTKRHRPSRMASASALAAMDRTARRQPRPASGRTGRKGRPRSRGPSSSSESSGLRAPSRGPAELRPDRPRSAGARAASAAAAGLSTAAPRRGTPTPPVRGPGAAGRRTALTPPAIAGWAHERAVRRSRGTVGRGPGLSDEARLRKLRKLRMLSLRPAEGVTSFRSFRGFRRLALPQCAPPSG